MEAGSSSVGYRIRIGSSLTSLLVPPGIGSADGLSRGLGGMDTKDIADVLLQARCTQ